MLFVVVRGCGYRAVQEISKQSTGNNSGLRPSLQIVIFKIRKANALCLLL